MPLKESDSDTEKEAIESPSDGEDALTESILQLQRKYFNERESQHDYDEVTPSKEVTGKGSADIKSTPKPKIVIPSVSEIFSEVSVSCEAKKQKPEATEKLENISTRKTNFSTGESAMSSIRTLGLPDEGYWHVPLTAFDVLKSSKKAVTDEKRRREKEVQKRAREESMVKRRITNEIETAPSRKPTIKEREKAKRAKGQSSQQSWKPEAFMRLRGEYD